MNIKKFTDGSTYYIRHKEKAIMTAKAWYWKNRERLIIEKRRKRGSQNPLVPKNNSRTIIIDGLTIIKTPKKIDKEAKEKILSHYGNICACCPEDNPKLLTVDHIENNGKEHGTGKIRYKGVMLYNHLIRLGFPQGIQILCFNCNIGKRNNGGICPHKGEKAI